MQIRCLFLTLKNQPHLSAARWRERQQRWESPSLPSGRGLTSGENFTSLSPSTQNWKTEVVRHKCNRVSERSPRGTWFMDGTMKMLVSFLL